MSTSNRTASTDDAGRAGKRDGLRLPAEVRFGGVGGLLLGGARGVDMLAGVGGRLIAFA